MKQWARVLAAVGIAAGLVIAACGDGASNGSAGLDAGADARGTPRVDGGSGPRPDPDPELDASDDGIAHPCTGKVVINELQVGGDGGAEFIELFNPTDCAIALGDWKLLYRSGNDVAGVGALHAFGVGDAIRGRTFLLLANAKFSGKIDADSGSTARALSELGRRDEAKKIWAEIATNYPKHELAAEAARLAK